MRSLRIIWVRMKGLIERDREIWTGKTVSKTVKILDFPTVSMVCLLAAAVGPACGFDLAGIERPRIMKKAERYLDEAPRTVTADSCERSAGGPNDFYSEGDYWWPDPRNPDGPYIRRDGETNPENFIAHRKSMIRLSDIVGTLVSAYLIGDDERHAAHAVKHLKAWFVDEATRMTPSLLYACVCVF